MIEERENETAGPLILIVDDEPKNLEVLTLILISENYRVLTACLGAPAIRLALENDPDLILLDAVLPEMDGFETCRQLRAAQATASIPLLMMVHQDERENIIRTYEVGAADYVTKPFKGAELLARVRHHLSLKQARKLLELLKIKLMTADHVLDLARRTDPLTHLSNRRDLLEKIEHEAARCARGGPAFSLVLCEIDGFADINRQYGAETGDFLLLSAANIIRGQVRRQDIVGRWGDKEFMLLLPGTNTEGARIIAEKLCRQIDAFDFQQDDLHLSLTLTCGVSVFEKEAETSVDCLEKTKNALLEARQAGGNRIAIAGAIA